MYVVVWLHTGQWCASVLTCLGDVCATDALTPAEARLTRACVARQWRVAAAEAILNFTDTDTSSHIKILKTILHPGEARAAAAPRLTHRRRVACIYGWPRNEPRSMAAVRAACAAARQVNKIRDVPGHPDLVVTHSDSKELFVWHTERQPARPPKARPQRGHALLSACDTGARYRTLCAYSPLRRPARLTPEGGCSGGLAGARARVAPAMHGGAANPDSAPAMPAMTAHRWTQGRGSKARAAPAATGPRGGPRPAAVGALT